MDSGIRALRLMALFIISAVQDSKGAPGGQGLGWCMFLEIPMRTGDCSLPRPSPNQRSASRFFVALGVSFHLRISTIRAASVATVT